jgi:SAM-dependent methyltransferase
MDPTRIVADGYDAIAERYRAWTEPHDPTRAWLVDAIADRVPAGAHVLEVGCGAGVPVGVALAGRYGYRGIDLSPHQIALARAAIPDAELTVADLRSVEIPRASIDAVVAAYVMGHVPVADRPGAYRRVATWLRPGGWWCASLPTGDDQGEGVELDWLGAPMFFASMPWEEERGLLETAGLRVEHEGIRVDDEDGRPVPFRWVFARRDRAPR